MGLSKKKSKTKSTSTATNAPSSYSQPYINDAAATLRPSFDAATANNAALMPRINSALDFVQGTMDGDRLDGNPHLDGIVEQTGRDITTGVDSRFSSAGRYGSGAHQGVLARALGDNASRLRYGDYAQERQYQAQAPGQLAVLSGVSAGLPQAAGSTYADQVRALMGQYNTQTGSGTNTSSQSGGMLGSILGAGLAGWASGGFAAPKGGFF